MNVVFTYCSFNKGEELDDFMFKLSLLSIGMAKRNIAGAHTVLYADNSTCERFKKIKFLDDVVTVDYSRYDFDHRFWCFPKFITYNMQEEPFVHIDLDLAIKKKVEIPFADVYSERLREFEGDIFETKYCDDTLPVPSSIYCSGIYGGHNLDVFKELFNRASFEWSTKRMAGKDVRYEYLYSMEEAYMTQLFIKKNLDVKTFDTDTYLHFWHRPKSQYEETVTNLLLVNDLL